jgi:hypothetical protein
MSSEGTTQERGLGIALKSNDGQMASVAMAAKSKALVEAKFTIAMHRPRNLMEARAKILEACKRPHFARTALYAKPVAGQKMIGPSIRFAETAIQCMTNIDVSTTTVYEDEEKRTINIAVTDLESNLSYGKDVTIAKTVERRQLKEGQQAISQRLNTYGEKVYLVSATDDEIQNKIAAQESKVIRNCGLRLIPSDIIEEATETIYDTREKGSKAEDPASAIKKIADAFQTLNISPVELEKYLGHGLATISRIELEDLRDIYQTIKDGEASWASYINKGSENAPPKETPKFGKKPDPDDAPPGAEMPPTKPKETPKKQPKADEGEVAQVTVERVLCDEGKVAFDDLTDYLVTTGLDLKAKDIGGYAELPVKLAITLAADMPLMKKIIALHGKAGK